MWHAKGSKKGDGPQGFIDSWDPWNFCSTQTLVVELIHSIHDPALLSSIYLDNLFVSERLMALLRTLGIGAAGTVRLSATKREKLEKKKDEKKDEKATA